MKKLFSVLAAALLCLCSSAQDAQSIMEDYLKKVGLEKHRGQTMRIEMEMALQGALVPLTITYPKNQTDMRIDMLMQTNEVSFVIVGDKGWIESGDQTQDLPAEFLAQTRQMTMFTSFSDMVSKSSMEYKGKTEHGGKEFHRIVVTRGKESYTIWVDAQTGLVEYVDTISQGASVRICFSDYKQFADVLLPSVITTAGTPQMVSTVTISTMSFNIDIPQWYFERP